jgi:hypothetical protein
MSEGRDTFVAVEPEPADMLAVAVAAVAAWLKRQDLEVVFRLRPKGEP